MQNDLQNLEAHDRIAVPDPKGWTCGCEGIATINGFLANLILTGPSAAALRCPASSLPGILYGLTSKSPLQTAVNKHSSEALLLNQKGRMSANSLCPDQPKNHFKFNEPASFRLLPTGNVFEREYLSRIERSP